MSEFTLKIPNRMIYNLQYSKIPFINVTQKIISKLSDIVDDIDYIIRYKNLFDYVISGIFDGIDNYNYQLEHKISNIKYGIGAIHLKKTDDEDEEEDDEFEDFISTLYSISLVLLRLSNLDSIKINKILKSNVHILCLNGMTSLIDSDISKILVDSNIETTLMTFEEYINLKFFFLMQEICTKSKYI